jgi:cbb3-type cytochrome oxidase maturation protein
MDVVWILVLLSLLLVGFSLLFFLYSMKQGDHEHADRLSLMPLEDDDGPMPKTQSSMQKGSAAEEPAEGRGNLSRDNKSQEQRDAVEEEDGHHPPSSHSRAPHD